MFQTKIQLIANGGPRSGPGLYSYALLKQLRQLDQANGLFNIVTFNNPRLDRLSFSLARSHFSGFMPIQTGMSAILHAGQLPKLRGHFDLYHITDAALGVVARFKRPSIVTVHDAIPFLHRRIGPRTALDMFLRASIKNIRYADSIIVDSFHGRTELLKAIEIDPSTIRVIPLGVDHDQFKPREMTDCRMRLGLPLDRNIVLHVGSEEPRKNVPFLIRSLAKLVKVLPNVLLIRLGAQESKEVATMISSNNLARNVTYLKLEREEIPSLYGAADVFVFPSLFEGFGLPLLEALSSGCPVVASNRQPIPEIIGSAGLLVDLSDADSFAAAIHRVITDESQRLSLRKIGISRSHGFSWRQTAASTLKVYNEVLESYRC